jgi:hypothetical protein
MPGPHVNRRPRSWLVRDPSTVAASTCWRRSTSSLRSCRRSPVVMACPANAGMGIRRGVPATSSSQLEAYAPGGMETNRRARAPTRERSSAGRSGPACSVSQRAYVSTGIVDRTSLPLGQARRRPLRTSMVSVSPGGTHPTGMARDAPTSPCPIRSHAQSSMANGIYPLRPRRLRAPRSHAQTGMTGRVSTPPLDRPARLRSRLPLGVLRRLASSL